VACAFKPNAAFFEVYGSAGWEALQRVLQLIPPEIPWLGAWKNMVYIIYNFMGHAPQLC
jgi:hypothetical protein